MTGALGLRASVLTPSLPDRRLLLDECIKSVAAQTVSVEHLVGVDDDRRGPSATRNRLAGSSDADWFLPLDDDDLIDPDCVQQLLASAGDADVVYPWCRVVDFGEQEPWCPNRLYRPEPLVGEGVRPYNYIPVTALVRASLWREVGGMPQAGHAEDFLFWRRCIGAGARFRCVPEVLWSYRRGLSGSRNQWAAAAA